jgi:hypothetical protein
MSLDMELIERLLPRACDPTTPGYSGNVPGETIEIFCSRNRLSLPDDLQDWLSRCLGYCLLSGKSLRCLSAERPMFDIEVLFESTPWRAKQWIPVGDDGCGDYYVVPCGSDGAGMYPVWFVDQSDYDSAAYVVASNVGRFVEFMLLDAIEFATGDPSGHARWPFDRGSVIARDSAIMRCRGVPLPWETGNR